MNAATTWPQLDAAVKARRQATAVAAVGAVVPTILAAQGMTSLAVDVLGFPLLAAVALASFLELALVASALLARAAALAGRPGGADAVAVWVMSATSGLLAGVHELMTVTPDGTTWSADPGTGLAAAMRVVAPLVAAWLWERVLRAARAEQAERTLAEVRRDRRLLAAARSALYVRRLQEAGKVSPRRERRAARRLDRAHVAALRIAPPAPTLVAVLAAVGQVDHLPAATIVSPLGGRIIEGNRVADVVAVAEPVAEPVADVVAVAEPVAEPVADVVAVAEPVAVAFPGAQVAADYMEDGQDAAPSSRPVLAAATARGASVSAAVRAPFEDVPLFGDGHEVDPADKLAVAVELMRDAPDMTGKQLADALTQRGHATATRSGLRWRERALETI